MSDKDDCQECPMACNQLTGLFMPCYPSVDKANRPVCAWWIPGAECCALVLIARRLTDLVALGQIEADRQEPDRPAIPF